MHDDQQQLLSNLVRKVEGSNDSLTTIFFRAIGFTLLNVDHRPGGNGQEQRTVAIQKSRSAALVRGLIHFLPLFGTIALITLNFNGVYIGADMVWLPILQFAAKGHEMSLLVSITAVVFSYLRYELVYHNIPFGALFAGFRVTELSYLWSPEFWGTASSEHFPGIRKFMFLLFIPLSILLAASVGPSSAIALIPRQTLFPAGLTSLWFNATEAEIYPNALDASNVPANCSLSPSYSIIGDACPYSEWLVIATLLNNYPGYTGDRWNTLQNEDTTRQIYLDVTTDQNINSVYVTTQQAAISEAFQDVVDFWTNAISSYPGSGGNPSRFHNHYDYLHLLHMKQPYVATRCLENNITYPVQGSANLTFPNRQLTWMPGNGYWTSSNLSAEYFTSNPPQPNDKYHITWIDLPLQQQFTNASLGAIISAPYNSTSAEISLYACTIYPSWGLATVNTTQNPSDIILSTNPPLPWEIFPSWDVQWVNISSSWAKYLTPPIADRDTSVDAAIFDLLGVELDPSVIDPNHPAYIHESVLSSLVANGMARNAYYAAAIGQNNDSLPTNSSIISWLLGKGHNLYDVDVDSVGQGYHVIITSSVEGLAYSMNDFAIKIAFVPLIIYVLYVLCHILYLEIVGLSSSSWDTIAELVVLALNSKSEDGLRHMTAGIRDVTIFKERVAIRSVARERLELVFGNSVDEKNGQRGKVEANRAY